MVLDQLSCVLARLIKKGCLSLSLTFCEMVDQLSTRITIITLAQSQRGLTRSLRSKPEKMPSSRFSGEFGTVAGVVV